MKYFKRLKVFKTKRCTFDPHAMTAWSYDWWKFVECRNNIVYFNAARYSMQTSKQQDMVEDALNHLGVSFKVLYVKEGLQAVDKAIINRGNEIKELEALIACPRTRKDKNLERLQSIRYLKAEITHLKKYNKMKATIYKGKLRFENLPKPEPLSEYQLAAREARLQMKQRQEWHKTFKQNLTVVQGGKQ